MHEAENYDDDSSSFSMGEVEYVSSDEEIEYDSDLDHLD